ncbi:MAG: hypothetical protein J0I11_21110 [Actinobacteria bacterium]|nr:hypothetical protein [Actinomycetota bacterium]
MSRNDAALRALIAAEAEYAEAHRDDPLPAGARATRPNRAKSAMFSLRLREDELAGIHELAMAADVPASAMVRGWIAERLASERSASATTAALIDRIESDVRALRKSVAS